MSLDVRLKDVPTNVPDGTGGRQSGFAAPSLTRAYPVRSLHLALNCPFSGKEGIVAQVKRAGFTGRAQARS
jgi:hypothetical protein